MYAVWHGWISLSNTLDTRSDNSLVKILRSQFVKVIGLQFSILLRAFPAFGSKVIVETLWSNGNIPM